MNQQKQNGNIIAIITMFFLFAMISSHICLWGFLQVICL